MQKFLKNYSLGIVLLLLFLGSWGMQALFQHRQEIQQAEEHGQELTTEQYFDSFLAATMENWQSEFLQLFTMVVLTSILIFKGSSESKDSTDEMLTLLRKIEKKLEKSSK